MRIVICTRLVAERLGTVRRVPNVGEPSVAIADTFVFSCCIGSAVFSDRGYPIAVDSLANLGRGKFNTPKASPMDGLDLSDGVACNHVVF